MLLNDELSVDAERIETIVRSINLYDEDLVCYGSKIQEKFATLTDKTLQSVIVLNQEKIDELTSEIRDIIEKHNDAKISGGLFRRKNRARQAKNEETSKLLDERARELDGQRMKVLVNLETLDNFHKQNLEYCNDLECHILAGRQKLQTVREGELKQLRQKVEQTEAPGDVAACNYLQDRIETFEERIHSLETSKIMSSQMTIQIRLMRSSNEQLMRQIDGGNSLISAWKQSAMVDTGK